MKAELVIKYSLLKFPNLHQFLCFDSRKKNILKGNSLVFNINIRKMYVQILKSYPFRSMSYHILSLTLQIIVLLSNMAFILFQMSVSSLLKFYCCLVKSWMSPAVEKQS